MEFSNKNDLFALNSYLGVSHCIEPCCGIVELNKFVAMTNFISSIGFDEYGNPCDYTDYQDIPMYYHGKGIDGSDNWYS